MKKIIFNLRYSALFIITVIACLCIMLIPDEDMQTLQWLAIMAASKLIGFVLIGVDCYLYKRWDSDGLIPELTKFINSEN